MWHFYIIFLILGHSEYKDVVIVKVTLEQGREETIKEKRHIMQPYTSLPCKHFLPGIVGFTCSYMGRPQLESSIRGACTVLFWLFLPRFLTFHYFTPPFTILCDSSLCHVFYCFSHAYLPFHHVKQIFCRAIHFWFGGSMATIVLLLGPILDSSIVPNLHAHFCVPNFSTQGNVTFFLPAVMVPW